MKLDKKQIKKIAELARLELSEKEVDKYSQELSAFLNHADKIQNIKTSEIEETSQVTGLENITREDAVIKANNQKDILDNAPQAKEDFIQVKSIF